MSAVYSRLLFVLLVFCAGSVYAAEGGVIETDQHTARLRILTEGLYHPWSMTFLPDGRMLVTEREGRLRIIDENWRLLPESVDGLPDIKKEGQGGLLDVALHPDYQKNRRIYISYAAEDETGVGTEVAYGTLDGDTLKGVRVIFRARPKQNDNRHFGSRLVFTPDGKLTITLGERGNRPEAQNLGSHLGTTIRLNPDGSVPDDNPFVGKQGAKPEIYTYGNRNVQGAALHPETGEVWTHEHGPQGGDEINILKPGINYGWPVITYGVNYGIGTKIGKGTHKEGMAQPLYYWDPSIAPSGMAFYTGDAFPDWKGDLFVGSLKFMLLVRLELNDGEVEHEERFLENKIGRIRDVRQGPDGYIYLLTDMDEAVLARLEPVKGDDK